MEQVSEFTFRKPLEVVIPGNVPILFQEGMRYECVKCGFGCQLMEVQLDEPSYRKILSLPLEHISPNLKKESLFVKSQSSELCRLAQTPDGKCVLLGEDNLCLLHKEFGYESKPQVCRDFPFRYTLTPDGLYVGLTFACSAMMTKEEMPDVATHEDTVRAQLRATSNLNAVGDKVALTDDLSLSWAEYKTVEGLLGKIFSMERITVS